jgi:hypothetical protein
MIDADVDPVRQRRPHDLGLFPLVRDPQRLRKLARAWVPQEDGDRKRMNRARPLRGGGWVIRHFLRQFGSRGAGECQELDTRGRIASEQVIDQRYQRGALSRTWPGKHAGVVPMIVGQNRGLLCSGGVWHRVCGVLVIIRRSGAQQYKSSRHRLSPLRAHIEDHCAPGRSCSHRGHVPVGGEAMRTFSISVFFPEVKPAHRDHGFVRPLHRRRSVWQGSCSDGRGWSRNSDRSCSKKR